MGQIKDIIDKRYKEIADKLISHKDKYYFDAKAPDSESFPHPVSEFDDCNEIFYIMLEEVSKCAELHIDRGGLFDFFGGHFFIDFGGIDTSGDVAAELLKAADFKRIAGIIYYAKHHKKYDEELEEAYFEAIGELFESISEPDDLLLVKTSTQACIITKDMKLTAAKEAYKEIYINNRYLLPRYIMDWKTFLAHVKNTIGEIQKQKLYSYIKCKNTYIRKMKEKIERDQYLSFNQCFDNKTGIPKSSYDRFFKQTVTVLAGFNYSELFKNCNIGDQFILMTMRDDVNAMMKSWYDYFKEAKPLIKNKYISQKNTIYIKYSEKRIFREYAKNYEGFRRISQTKKLYLQILIGKNPKKGEDDFTIYTIQPKNLF